uniref:Uncharacterized protein n=1 Tax=Kalanchoe fedtschenkoi TaxID=63787 RepID=A0A7N0TIQ6_KALFE
MIYNFLFGSSVGKAMLHLLCILPFGVLHFVLSLKLIPLKGYDIFLGRYMTRLFAKGYTETKINTQGFSLIPWKCRKQTTVSGSSVEDEYRALVQLISEVVWLVNIIKSLQVSTPHVNTFCDRKSVITIAFNPVLREPTKHIDWIGFIKMPHLPSSEQPADILTQALPSPLFMHLNVKLAFIQVVGWRSYTGL